jgi:large subunit ribosomal protein L17
MAKEDTLHKRRMAFDTLRDRDMVLKLFTDIAPFFKNRPGGYLRILKFNFRKGDNAPMAIVQLVDRDQETSAA